MRQRWSGCIGRLPLSVDFVAKLGEQQLATNNQIRTSNFF
jgi:hypothetical protein